MPLEIPTNLEPDDKLFKTEMCPLYNNNQHHISFILLSAVYGNVPGSSCDRDVDELKQSKDVPHALFVQSNTQVCTTV